jgi:hypothetical protein
LATGTVSKAVGPLPALGVRLYPASAKFLSFRCSWESSEIPNLAYSVRIVAGAPRRGRVMVSHRFAKPATFGLCAFESRPLRQNGGVGRVTRHRAVDADLLRRLRAGLKSLTPHQGPLAQRQRQHAQNVFKSEFESQGGHQYPSPEPWPRRSRYTINEVGCGCQPSKEWRLREPCGNLRGSERRLP